MHAEPQMRAKGEVLFMTQNKAAAILVSPSHKI